MSMTYEALKSKGLAKEKGRRGPGGLIIIKYRGRRPNRYDGYVSVFKGNPDEMMDWLEERKVAWGLNIEKRPKPARVFQLFRREAKDVQYPGRVLDPEPGKSSIQDWLFRVAAAGAAAGVGYLIYSAVT